MYIINHLVTGRFCVQITIEIWPYNLCNNEKYDIYYASIAVQNNTYCAIVYSFVEIIIEIEIKTYIKLINNKLVQK